MTYVNVYGVCSHYYAAYSGPCAVWICGHLPLRAAGPGLYHRSYNSRDRVPAEAYIWPPSK